MAEKILAWSGCECTTTFTSERMRKISEWIGHSEWRPPLPGDLLAVPVDQHEIVGSQNFAKSDAVALHPETRARIVAHRQMPERHVAVAFHFEDSAGARGFGETVVGV